MQIVDKSACSINNFLRTFAYFERARDALGFILDFEGISSGDKILLPAYIGWSPKEGSGVFDPVEQRKIKPEFYKIDNNLRVDYTDAVRKMSQEGIRAIVIIHYFGFVDEGYKALVETAKRLGVLVIEDAAHAFLSDFVGGICGRIGDYTIYSLHKMFPFQSGGMLSVNSSNKELHNLEKQCHFGDPFRYDFYEISKKRIENYNFLTKLLSPYYEKVKPLYKEIPSGVVPQSYPVRIIGYDRYKLYQQMNDAGWGFVSLYHTMIEQLRNSQWSDSLELAGSIMNLPVHQDVNKQVYEKMVYTMMSIIDNN